jgi:hypothetical protein
MSKAVSRTASPPTTTPLWFSASRQKQHDELFFLIYSAVWIAVFGTIVTTKAYEGFGDLGYMLVGLFVALPYCVIPLCFPTAVWHGA